MNVGFKYLGIVTVGNFNLLQQDSGVSTHEQASGQAQGTKRFLCRTKGLEGWGKEPAE